MVHENQFADRIKVVYEKTSTCCCCAPALLSTNYKNIIF
jgi:hypothetical protein